MVLGATGGGVPPPVAPPPPLGAGALTTTTGSTTTTSFDTSPPLNNFLKNSGSTLAFIASAIAVFIELKIFVPSPCSDLTNTPLSSDMATPAFSITPVDVFIL